jgi:hypothetical protein
MSGGAERVQAKRARHRNRGVLPSPASSTALVSTAALHAAFVGTILESEALQPFQATAHPIFRNTAAANGGGGSGVSTAGGRGAAISEDGKDSFVRATEYPESNCCAICFADDASFAQKAVRLTRCTHVFCEDCLIQWARQGSRACPLCKGRFTILQAPSEYPCEFFFGPGRLLTRNSLWEVCEQGTHDGVDDGGAGASANPDSGGDGGSGGGRGGNTSSRRGGGGGGGGGGDGGGGGISGSNRSKSNISSGNYNGRKSITDGVVRNSNSSADNLRISSSAFPTTSGNGGGRGSGDKCPQQRVQLTASAPAAASSSSAAPLLPREQEDFARPGAAPVNPALQPAVSSCARPCTSSSSSSPAVASPLPQTSGDTKRARDPALATATKAPGTTKTTTATTCSREEIRAQVLRAAERRLTEQRRKRKLAAQHDDCGDDQVAATDGNDDGNGKVPVRR